MTSYTINVCLDTYNKFKISHFEYRTSRAVGVNITTKSLVRNGAQWNEHGSYIELLCEFRAWRTHGSYVHEAATQDLRAKKLNLLTYVMYGNAE